MRTFEKNSSQRVAGEFLAMESTWKGRREGLEERQWPGDWEGSRLLSRN